MAVNYYESMRWKILIVVRQAWANLDVAGRICDLL